MSAHILTINHDASLNIILTTFLVERDFKVTHKVDGQEAIVFLGNTHVDCIIINANLPGYSTCSLIRQIRQSKKTPVVVLSNSDEASRLSYFKAGADECFAPAASLLELEMRIIALLRRMRWTGLSENIQLHELNEGLLHLNRAKQMASFDGQDLELTPIQFKLLWTLIENKSEILTKPFLYRVVFNKEFQIYDRGLDIHISRIRKKLADNNDFDQRLVTAHGKGYCFS